MLAWAGRRFCAERMFPQRGPPAQKEARTRKDAHPRKPAHVMQQRDAKPAPQAMLFVRSATPRRNGTDGANGPGYPKPPCANARASTLRTVLLYPIPRPLASVFAGAARESPAQTAQDFPPFAAPAAFHPHAKAQKPGPAFGQSPACSGWLQRAISWPTSPSPAYPPERTRRAARRAWARSPRGARDPYGCWPA